MNVAHEKPAPQLVDTNHEQHDDNQRSSSRWSPWLRTPASRRAAGHTDGELGNATSAKSG